MSFFSEASLAMIPSGYKTSKVYSALPTSGDGDLTFTRSNDTATRVGPNGYIEKVRTNVLTYSQDFSNANWVGFDVSRTGSQTDPNGGTTASLYTSLTNSANVSANFSTVSSSPYTLSIYIKGTTSGIVSLRVDSGSTAAQNNISYTTAWQRFTYTFTAGASTSTVVLGGYASFTTGEEIYVAFAQAELGDIATDYIATTSAAVTVGPVANVPRLDYLDSSSPRLLLEPQRTNLVTYSEQINTGFTTSQGGTGLLPVITANNAISPDGYQNADTIVFDAGAGTTSSDISAIRQVFGGTTATYTCSFYAKTPSGTAQIQVRIDGSSYEKFTITNEWQRFTLTRALTGTSNQLDFAIRRGLNEPMNASATIQLWGVQVELGAYATSYIPTLGAAVTRGSDAASKTGISSLIGQTEGTIFIDVNLDTVSAQTNDPVLIYLRGTNVETYIEIIDNGGVSSLHFNSGVQATIDAPAGSVIAGRNKFAFTYKQNDFALYLNGVLIGTDTSGTVGAQDEFGFQYNNSAFEGQQKVSQALVFPTRLSNDDLAALTA